MQKRTEIFPSSLHPFPHGDGKLTIAVPEYKKMPNIFFTMLLRAEKEKEGTMLLLLFFFLRGVRQRRRQRQHFCWFYYQEVDQLLNSLKQSIKILIQESDLEGTSAQIHWRHKHIRKFDCNR